MKLNLAEDKEFISKLVKLTVPIVLQHLMLALVAVADALMLGNIEQNAMSAVSLATQIQFLQNMIMVAPVTTVAILGAQYWGKGDVRSVNDVFLLGLRACGIVSLITFVGCVFAPRYLMLAFTNEEVLIEIGVRYLKIAGWSYLMTGVSQCYLTAMKVSEHPGQVARITTGTVVLNIVLNAILIYGMFGAPALEEQGAAIATLISRGIELGWILVVSFKPHYIRPNLRRLFRVGKALWKDFYRCTMPLLGAALIWSVGFTSYSSFMGHLGTDAAAANSVAAVVRDLICCICDGVCGGGSIIVGYELGAGNLKQGKLYGDKLVVIAFAIGILSTLIMLMITPLLVSVVKLTDTAKSHLLGMMVVMAVYMIGRVVNTIVINGIFAAGGDTVFDVYSLAICMWCIAVPLAAVGTFFLHWSVVLVYACTCLDEVGKIPWVMYHYKKYKWVKDLTRENIT